MKDKKKKRKSLFFLVFIDSKLLMSIYNLFYSTDMKMTSQKLMARVTAKYRVIIIRLPARKAKQQKQ